MKLSACTHSKATVQALAAALRSGRIHHAFLFTGPEGAGRAATAMAFAASLLCPTRAEDGDRCGTCPACQKTLAGSHPDLHRLEPDGEQIKIAAVRALCGRLNLHANEGGYKVVMVRRAERMNPAAQNALLKTLEEPPGRTVFVLIAPSSRALLPTVRSRCQELRFSPLAPAAAAEALTAEGVEAGRARFAALVTDGGLEAARALAQSEAGQEGTAALFRALLSGTAEELLDLAESHGASRESLSLHIDLWQRWLRDALVIATSRAPGELAFDAFSEELRALARAAGRTRLINWFESLESLRAKLERNAQPRSQAEALLIGWLRELRP